MFGPSDGSSRVLRGVVRHAQESGTLSGCESQIEGRRARVRLWGHLPAEWCGNLSLHCYATGVSIFDADARRLPGGIWAACLLIDAPGLDLEAPGSSYPACDYLAMARHRPALAPGRSGIELESYRLDRRPGDGGLLLHIRSVDRLGLLAGLFRRILDCGLRPYEITVRTRAGRAEDWIVLEGLGGKPADEDAQETLREEFESALEAPR